MDQSNRKRRGFMKGKLMPFYRAAKPSTGSVQYMTTSSKVIKPSQSSLSAPSVGFLVHSDYVMAQPAPTVSNTNNSSKVSFILPEHFETLYGVAGDEAVDSKAASYISSMQERFKSYRDTSVKAALIN